MHDPEQILPMFLRSVAEQSNVLDLTAEQSQKISPESQAKENPYLARTALYVLHVPNVQPPITPREVMNVLAQNADREGTVKKLGASVLPVHTATIFVADGEELGIETSVATRQKDPLSLLSNRALAGINFVFRFIDTQEPLKTNTATRMQQIVDELVANRRKNIDR